MQVALRDSSALFAPALVRALQADAEAQTRTPEEIVGLDGDPFLDAQDFCDAYTVGGARRQGEAVVVAVRGNCPGRADTLPDVVAEIRPYLAGWVFVNFRYPRRASDLRRDLDDLRRAREAQANR